MTQSTWLNLFKQKLAKNKAVVTNAYQPLIFGNKNTYVSKLRQYLTPISTENIENINSIDTRYHYYNFDLAAKMDHLTQDYKYLDVALQDVSDHSAGILSNNYYLEQLNAPYRIVILNATNDYLINYFPNKMEQWSNKLFNSQNLINDSLQCLCFIDLQGNCFLALPCALNASFTNNKINELEVTCASIKRILRDFSSYKLADNYVSLLVENNFCDNLLTYLNYRHINQRVRKIISNINKHSNMNMIYTDADIYSDIFINIAYKYELLLKDTLKLKLQVNVLSNGHVDISYPEAKNNEFWQQQLTQKYHHLSETVTKETALNIIDKVVHELMLLKINTLHLKFNQQPQITNINVSNITSTDSTSMVPLMEADGLNYILNSFQAGMQHNYYLTKNNHKYKLTSLYGKCQIEKVKEAYYE